MSACSLILSWCKKARHWPRQKFWVMLVPLVLLGGIACNNQAQVHAAVVSVHAFDSVVSVEGQKTTVESWDGAGPAAMKLSRGRSWWEGLLSFEPGRTTFERGPVLMELEQSGWRELTEHESMDGTFWSRVVERAEWIPMIASPPLSLLASLPAYRPAYRIEPSPTPPSVPERVPLPGAIILFGSGLFGVVAIVARLPVPLRRQESGGGPIPVVPKANGILTIVFVSSDEKLAAEIDGLLRRAGYHLHVVLSVAEAVALANRHAFSYGSVLLLVDRRIPEWDMLRTDPKLRRAPILLVVPPGATEDDDDFVDDLERGADGVFACDEGDRLLVAVIGAYCRRIRHRMAQRGVYEVGHVRLDADSHEVTIAGEPVHLSAKQFSILHVLLSEPFKVFSRRELIDLVWGPGFAVGHHTLDVHIHALRHVLNRDPDRCCAIEAIKGVGFKFKVFRREDDAGCWCEQARMDDTAGPRLVNVERNKRMILPVASSREGPVSAGNSTATLLRRPRVPLRPRAARGDRRVVAERVVLGKL